MNACAQIASATPGGTNSGLDKLRSVAVSADGTSVYAASPADDAVARFDREPQPAPSPTRAASAPRSRPAPPEPAPAPGSAARRRTGRAPVSTTRRSWVGADGLSLYTASGNDAAVARFDREPQTTITSAPARSVQRQRATLRFRSSEPRSTFECNLKRRHFRPCASPKTYRHLKLGRQVFKVRATGRSKNTDSTPAKRRWRIR